MDPSSLFLGQNTCRIAPQGFEGSVPKKDFPSFPILNPGAICVTVRSIMTVGSTTDLIV